MLSDSYQAKVAVLSQIAASLPIVVLTNARASVGPSLVHLRFCSANKGAPDRFKFNINPNTLSADFELWICGGPLVFYLMPVSLMRRFYQHPEAYIDRRHPNIRIVSVDARQHKAMYARRGTSADLTPYFRAVLPQSTH